MFARARQTDIQNETTRELAAGVSHNRYVGISPIAFIVSAHLEEQRVGGDPPTTATRYFGHRRTFRRTDDLLLPRAGYLASAELGGSPPGLATQEFLRFVASVSLLMPVGRYVGDLLIRGQVGSVVAETRQGIPTTFLFRTGGDQTVRGYEFESLGIQQGDAIVGGRRLAVGSMEYTHWIGENWGAAAFVDIGNAWDESLLRSGARLRRRRALPHSNRTDPRRSCLRREDRTIQDPFFRGLYVLAMRWLSGALLALAVLLLAAAAGIGWLVGTEQGLQWAAARVPGLHTEGLRGHLAGEVTAETLSFESSAVRLRAEQVSVRAHLAALLGGRLTLEPFRAQRSSSSFAARVKNQASRFACRYSFTSATRASIRLSCKDTSSAISRSSTHGSGKTYPSPARSLTRTSNSPRAPRWICAARLSASRRASPAKWRVSRSRGAARSYRARRSACSRSTRAPVPSISRASARPAPRSRSS